MPSQRSLSQWIAVATVVPVVVFAFGHVHGQAQNQGRTGAEATFQGRPAMAGAQAGTGAMAGPPQGGVAPQATDQPGGGLVLRAPSAVRDRDITTPKEPDKAVPRKGEEAVPRDPGMDKPNDGELAPRRDRDSGEVIKREHESTGDESTVKKVRKSAKRTLDHSRRGVPSVQ